MTSSKKSTFRWPDSPPPRPAKRKITMIPNSPSTSSSSSSFSIVDTARAIPPQARIFHYMRRSAPAETYTFAENDSSSDADESDKPDSGGSLSPPPTQSQSSSLCPSPSPSQCPSLSPPPTPTPPSKTSTGRTRIVPLEVLITHRTRSRTPHLNELDSEVDKVVEDMMAKVIRPPQPPQSSFVRTTRKPRKKANPALPLRSTIPSVPLTLPRGSPITTFANSYNPTPQISIPFPAHLPPLFPSYPPQSRHVLPFPIPTGITHSPSSLKKELPVYWPRTPIKRLQPYPSPSSSSSPIYRGGDLEATADGLHKHDEAIFRHRMSCGSSWNGWDLLGQRLGQDAQTLASRWEELEQRFLGQIQDRH